MILKASEWANVTKIGRSKIVSLTILVPIFGYLILFNEHLINLFEISGQIFSEVIESSDKPSSSSVSSESKTRMYYFYFGLTFLGIGSIVYQIFCPKIIKEYASNREYVREETAFMTEKRVKHISSQLDKNKKVITKNLQEILASYENGWLIANDDAGFKKNAAITDLLFLYWKSENQSKIIARTAVFLFYIAGFLALAYPSLLMFLKVAKAYIS